MKTFTIEFDYFGIDGEFRHITYNNAYNICTLKNQIHFELTTDKDIYFFEFENISNLTIVMQ